MRRKEFVITVYSSDGRGIKQYTTPDYDCDSRGINFKVWDRDKNCGHYVAISKEMPYIIEQVDKPE